MRKIEIDDEVFESLQRRAEAFVDTPNSVLRRLLAIDSNQETLTEMTTSFANKPSVTRSPGRSSDTFVRGIWTSEFKSQPHQVGRFRMMFEDDSNIVYFQNFNKSNSPNLWYRLNPSPLQTLLKSEKNAWICLTNPAEETAYLIPLSNIYDQARKHDWNRSEFEVNIDAGEERWREFNWILKEFRVR